MGTVLKERNTLCLAKVIRSWILSVSHLLAISARPERHMLNPGRGVCVRRLGGEREIISTYPSISIPLHKLSPQTCTSSQALSHPPALITALSSPAGMEGTSCSTVALLPIAAKWLPTLHTVGSRFVTMQVPFAVATCSSRQPNPA